MSVGEGEPWIIIESLLLTCAIGLRFNHTLTYSGPVTGYWPFLSAIHVRAGTLAKSMHCALHLFLGSRALELSSQVMSLM